MPFSRPAMRKKSSPEGVVSLYVHIPFCEKKCPYCSFFSTPVTGDKIEKFLVSLERETALLKAAHGVIPPVRTAYIGGGTPTVLAPSQWSRLIAILEKGFRFLSGSEVSVEANPGSISTEHLSVWKDWRVTRVSIGVQSLVEKDLAILGRPHNASQSAEAIGIVDQAGLSPSADLLFGLPGQEIRGWHESLEGVIRAGVDHVSVYQLTLDPGTPWGDNPPAGLPDGYPFYRWAQYYLEYKGYRQYEIASFAKPGKWCRHNAIYWLGGDFIGIGPSAWSCRGFERSKNAGDADEYYRLIIGGERPVCFTETLEGEALASERAILALRTRWGIRFQRFRADFGERALDVVIKKLEELPSRLLTRTPGRISLSREGMRVGNAVWQKLLP